MPETGKEINVREWFNVLKRRYVIIVSVLALFLLGTFLYSKFTMSPLYQSSARIIIGADPERMKTLQVIIRDPAVMTKVVKKAGLKTTPEALAGQIVVQSINESQVVSITATDANAERAAKIANTTAKVFKKQVPNLYKFKDVRLLSSAKVNFAPINDNFKRNMYFGLFGGLAVGILIGLFFESLDGTVRSKKEIEDLGIPVLGKVAKFKQK
ncbi:capsular polysaccharide biosynthesis protein [Fictibacillus macauensis ZFHKF-1]|uniref:Capsular polysaccharide biosynthesis protein n=1 Tax=Fictibacillus macauensis ZFHKF-1 TaxID=1196324 RepID=I8J432_9BACL|nr:Wzz/FepE/Etk N-terminal domain-containing protein [Fictibacillus macauensis]EIT86526.1 capsular polysaccharide biosynthesis protein [Fictibacillus macauensis ZFHKF-1]